MSYYDLNKRCLELIETRLRLTDSRIKNDGFVLNRPEKLEYKLELKAPYAYSLATENVLNEKRICLDKVKVALNDSSLNYESQVCIYNECERVVEPTNTNDIGKNVEKFIADQPELTENPESNKMIIENWAKELNAPVKEMIKQDTQGKTYEALPQTPSITQETNDKTEKPAQKRKIDIERDI